MKLPSVGLPLNASKLESMLKTVFVFQPVRTGTNVKLRLMSHVRCYPLKGPALSVVHIMGWGNPGQTIQSNLGIVGVRVASVLRSTEIHPHEFRFVLPSFSTIG